MASLYLARPLSSLEDPPVLHGESLPRRSDLSRSFTASLFLAGRLSSLERSPLLHGGSLPRRSGITRNSLYLPCKLESSRCFTASLVLAGRSRLSVSRRVSFLQIICLVSALSSSSSRRVSCAQVRNHDELFVVSSSKCRSRLVVSRRALHCRSKLFTCFHGGSLPCRSLI